MSSLLGLSAAPSTGKRDPEPNSTETERVQNRPFICRSDSKLNRRQKRLHFECGNGEAPGTQPDG
jgi:hypothetical protein